MLQFSFRFFFLFSLFFHSAVIDTMIRNTGRLSIRFRIERNDGVWDNLGRDRESSCKISIKFMRWIDDSRDSSYVSWVAGKRERRSRKEWWTKKRNGIDRGLSMSPFYRRSYIIVALSPFQDLLNSAVSFLRRNIDTHACDLYGEIECAITESPHGGMDP